MIEPVKIPEQRKGVLIGKDGSTKKGIEARTRTKITVNNGIEIDGEPLDVLKAKEIVKAIGRGFAPDKAMKLISDDYRLVVISLGDETEKRMKRIFSRIIGKAGKSRRILEHLTKTDICIYGKTISIIGNWSNAEKANEAIELLVKGKTHAYVYRCLESDMKASEEGE
jgi:ribosomal RNA assembly protein